MDRISVGRPYECFCGQEIAFDYVCQYIEERSGGALDSDTCRILVVSDRNVGGYFYSRFEQQFLDKGIRPNLTIIDAKESYKNLSSVAEVTKSLVDFDFRSGDWVIALGGGGVLDVTAFATSLYSADIKLILVPTTLNAMAEGSVAQNAYINSGSHKNALMAKTDITAVFADPEFLKSVPDKIKTNGYAAVIRYAVIDNPPLLKELLADSDLRVFLEKVYESRTSIENKNKALLTMGSEISDAIEGYFRFMNYSEGETLALGIYSAVPVKFREPLRVLYNKLGLPYVLSGVSSKMILKNLEDSLRRKNADSIELVDLDVDKRTWVVKNLEYDKAIEILKKRIGVICAE